MDLNSLICQLDRFAPDMEAVARFLSQRDTATLCGAVCNSILSDVALAQTIAQRSYRHPNGFDKFIVHTGPRFTLRMHVWWPESPGSREHIHNHRWDFATLVLVGGYVQEIFEIERAGGGTKLCRHVDTPAEATGGVYTHRYVDDVTLGLIASGALSRGCSASMRSHVAHRVTVNAETTATLFVHGPFLTRESHVYADAPLSAPDRAATSNEGSRMDPIEMERKLLRLLKLFS